MKKIIILCAKILGAYLSIKEKIQFLKRKYPIVTFELERRDKDVMLSLYENGYIVKCFYLQDVMNEIFNGYVFFYTYGKYFIYYNNKKIWRGDFSLIENEPFKESFINGKHLVDYNEK